MGLVTPFEILRSLGDFGFSDDEGRLGACFGEVERVVYLGEIVPVYRSHGKTYSFKPFFHIFAKSDTYLTFDGNVVAVIDEDEVIQTVMPRERARFVADSLLQVTVPAKAIDFMIDDMRIFSVQDIRGIFPRHRKSHGICHALP